MFFKASPDLLCQPSEFNRQRRNARTLALDALLFLFMIILSCFDEDKIEANVLSNKFSTIQDISLHFGVHVHHDNMTINSVNILKPKLNQRLIVLVHFSILYCFAFSGTGSPNLALIMDIFQSFLHAQAARLGPIHSTQNTPQVTTSSAPAHSPKYTQIHTHTWQEERLILRARDEVLAAISSIPAAGARRESRRS